MNCLIYHTHFLFLARVGALTFPLLINFRYDTIGKATFDLDRGIILYDRIILFYSLIEQTFLAFRCAVKLLQPFHAVLKLKVE